MNTNTGIAACAVSLALAMSLSALALPDAERAAARADDLRTAQDGRAALVSPEWRAWYEWHEWGSGDMRWLGFRLYRATLWVAGQRDGVLRDEAPLALTLAYHRGIPGRRIVEASVDQMRRQGAGEAQLNAWAAGMQRVFPDVAKGDTLTGIHLPGKGARFFHGDRPVGEIADPEFARRFFAIWLDPRTSAPEVRAALLRLPPE